MSLVKSPFDVKDGRLYYESKLAVFVDDPDLSVDGWETFLRDKAFFPEGVRYRSMRSDVEEYQLDDEYPWCLMLPTGFRRRSAEGKELVDGIEYACIEGGWDGTKVGNIKWLFKMFETANIVCVCVDAGADDYYDTREDD